MNRRQYPYQQASLVSLLVFLCVIFPMIYPIIKSVFIASSSQATEVVGLSRAFTDLFIFSAKPLDYLVPSKYNPFLGWLVPDLGFGSLKGHRYTEHTLYLGYSIMALGAYAFYRTVRKAGELGRSDSARRSVYLFFVLLIFTVILSAPPFIPLGDYSVDYETREIIAESKFYMPQYFLFKVFPMFRVYARVGSIVLLALCVLGAFGLKDISLQHQNEQLPGVRRVAVSLASPIDSLMVLKAVASILFVKVLPLYMTPACCG